VYKKVYIKNGNSYINSYLFTINPIFYQFYLWHAYCLVLCEVFEMKKRSAIATHNNLKSYFDEIKLSNLLSFEEEVELSKKIQMGDKEAFNKMVNSNLRLVVKISKKYMTPEWELSDLIQEGNIGLLKAIEKFDYKRNVRFSTYASWWIKQSIMRSISNKRRTIRLPHRKEEKLRKINYTINEMFQELKRYPTVKEISAKLGYSEYDILNLRNFSDNLISIDMDVNNEGYSIINLIDDDSYSPEKIYDKNDMQKVTSEILEKLKDKERQILRQRFAFEGNEKETLKTIAKKLDISPETVRQIEIRAIKKIKDNYSYLKDYLYT
jgi:RNA polymerase primary sigma factor